MLSSALVESVANFVGKCHILTYVLTCSLTSRLFLLQYIQKQCPVGILRKMSVVYFDEWDISYN